MTGKDALSLALSGGEDYRLLVTVDPARVRELVERIEHATGRHLHDVGEIVAGHGVSVRHPDGRTTALEPSGWDHFTTRAGAPPSEGP